MHVPCLAATARMHPDSTWRRGAALTLLLLLTSRLLQGTTAQAGGSKGVIQLIGLHPLTGDWPDGEALRFVSDVAIDHINKHPDFLPDYQLNVTWIDSGCKGGMAVYRMVQELYRPPTKGMVVIGGGCSIVCRATSEFSHYFQISQISPEAVTPSLSNKDFYPRFFRVWPPDSARNPMLIRLFQFFQWKKVATLTQLYEIFQYTTDHLVGLMDQNNITLLASELIQESPKKQITILKHLDARIIVGNMWEWMSRRVFCEAYKQGLYGPHIVWILLGWMTTTWWEVDDPEVDCTWGQMKTATEGAIYGNVVLQNPNMDEMTMTGLTAQQIEDYLLELDPKAWDLFAYNQRFFFWDTVLAAALALNTTANVMANAPPGSPLHGKKLTDFNYDQVEMGLVMKESIAKGSFVGSLGLTEFDQNGNPKSIFDVWYQIDGKRVLQGYFKNVEDGTSQLLWQREGAIDWRGGRVPSDSTRVEVRLVFLSLNVYLTLTVIAGLGILTALVFLIFSIAFREKRIIKMSSPRLNNIILVGCMTIFATVFFYEQDESLTQSFCMVRNFTLTIGFSMVFGALFSKTWRVHVIFASKNVKSMTIKDSKLFGMVVGIITVNLVVLLLWVILDPYYVVMKVQSEERVSAEEDVVIRYQLPVCQSHNATYFYGTLYIIQGLLLTFGAFLAFETRKVKLEALNDSQLIGTCIYHVVILSGLGVGLGMVLSDEVHLMAALNGVFAILATFCTQLIIFLPKVIAVIRGQADVKPTTIQNADTASTTNIDAT